MLLFPGQMAVKEKQKDKENCQGSSVLLCSVFLSDDAIPLGIGSYLSQNEILQAEAIAIHLCIQRSSLPWKVFLGISSMSVAITIQ